MKTTTASPDLIAHSNIPASDEFHPSAAWEEKMALLEQIHGEIAPHSPAINETDNPAVELDFLLD